VLVFIEHGPAASVHTSKLSGPVKHDMWLHKLSQESCIARFV